MPGSGSASHAWSAVHAAIEGPPGRGYPNRGGPGGPLGLQTRAGFFFLGRKPPPWGAQTHQGGTSGETRTVVYIELHFSKVRDRRAVDDSSTWKA